MSMKHMRFAVLLVVVGTATTSVAGPIEIYCTSNRTGHHRHSKATNWKWTFKKTDCSDTDELEIKVTKSQLCNNGEQDDTLLRIERRNTGPPKDISQNYIYAACMTVSEIDLYIEVRTTDSGISNPTNDCGFAVEFDYAFKVGGCSSYKKPTITKLISQNVATTPTKSTTYLTTTVSAIVSSSETYKATNLKTDSMDRTTNANSTISIVQLASLFSSTRTTTTGEQTTVVNADNVSPLCEIYMIIAILFGTLFMLILIILIYVLARFRLFWRAKGSDASAENGKESTVELSATEMRDNEIYNMSENSL